MRKNLTAGIALVGFALIATTPANAVIKIDFDTLQSSSFSTSQFVFVDNYYDGGTSTPGFLDGPDYGVTFNGFVVASGYGETSQPNFAVTIYIAPAIIDVAAGFRGESLSPKAPSLTTFSNSTAAWTAPVRDWPRPSCPRATLTPSPRTA